MLKFISKHLLVGLLIMVAFTSCQQQQEVQPNTQAAERENTPPVVKLTQEELSKFLRSEEAIALKEKLMDAVSPSLKENLGKVTLSRQDLLKLKIAFAEKFLEANFLQTMRPTIDAINAKYAGKIDKINEKAVLVSLEADKVALKVAKSSRTSCRPANNKKIEQRLVQFDNAINSCARIVGGRANYHRASALHRRLFDISLMSPAKHTFNDILPFVFHNLNGCDPNFRPGISYASAIALLAYGAQAEALVTNRAKLRGVRAHFTNRPNTKNIALRPRVGRGVYMRAPRYGSSVDAASSSIGDKSSEVGIFYKAGGNGLVFIQDLRGKRRILDGNAQFRLGWNQRNTPNAQWYIEPGSANYTIRLYNPHKKRKIWYDVNRAKYLMGTSSGASYDFYVDQL